MLLFSDNHEADPIYSRKDGQYAGKSTNSTTVILQQQTDPICLPSTSRINNEGDLDAPDATVIQGIEYKGKLIQVKHDTYLPLRIKTLLLK